MFNRIGLVVVISLFVSACGGGGSESPTVVINPEDKIYDIAEYLNNKSTKPEFYSMEYFYSGGEKAWVDINGESVAEPLTPEDKKKAFNKLKVINEYVGDIALSRTKYLNSDQGNEGVDGPFLFADHTPIYVSLGVNNIKKFRESQGNDAYSDMTVLDKYNFEIPRKYKHLDTLVINNANSSMTNTYDVCLFEFKKILNLSDVTLLASGIHNDVLKLSCSVFSSQDDSSVGYRNYYFEKNVGEIHRTTSLGQGTIEHIVTGRKFLN
ncbi:MAG: hypothetical protein L3J59_10375 [Methylococcaceae bacterium]|nr:hypothetical protein [Methylococcaceae bacterium]